jgi:hypothetical protein
MPAPKLARLDAWIRATGTPMSRPAAIRRLIEVAMAPHLREPTKVSPSIAELAKAITAKNRHGEMT